VSVHLRWPLRPTWVKRTQGLTAGCVWPDQQHHTSPLFCAPPGLTSCWMPQPSMHWETVTAPCRSNIMAGLSLSISFGPLDTRSTSAFDLCMPPTGTLTTAPSFVNKVSLLVVMLCVVGSSRTGSTHTNEWRTMHTNLVPCSTPQVATCTYWASLTSEGPQGSRGGGMTAGTASTRGDG
jgi:hypothetical protein